jgi:hypothetical protein
VVEAALLVADAPSSGRRPEDPTIGTHAATVLDDPAFSR